MRITIPDHRPTSWNALYAGIHWRKRKRLADQTHALVRACTPPDAAQYETPVHITVTVYFANRPMDADNIAAKLYIDGLSPRVIADDSPKYVRSVRTVSLVDKSAPRVEIQIEPVEQ